jgi:NAD(P)-dependent dehydrogenase (short-subunit alcohol dehydrogenase family)
VIITARNEERLNETLELLEGDGHQKVIADLTIMDNIDMLVNSVPQLDGLVNNAGISKLLPVQFLNEDDLSRVLKINTITPVFLTQRLYKKKRFNRNASIVFTSSIGGVFTVTPGSTMYGMSKGALNVFMKYAALEMSQKGIRCNCVNPGMIETELMNKDTYTEEERAKNIVKYPLKRFGQPKEVAFGIVYLLSNASAWVTGSSLVIDGGFTL